MLDVNRSRRACISDSAEYCTSDKDRDGLNQLVHCIDAKWTYVRVYSDFEFANIS